MRDSRGIWPLNAISTGPGLKASARHGMKAAKRLIVSGWRIPVRVGGSGPEEVSFQLTLPEYRYIHLIAICSLQSIVPGVAISPETSIIRKLALSGDLPSHQSICRIFVKFNRKYSTGVRELLSGEEVQTQKNRLVRPVFLRFRIEVGSPDRKITAYN